MGRFGSSVVSKFGGSSLATAAEVRQVVGRIEESLGEGPTVVLSASGNTTNQLSQVLDLAKSGHHVQATELLGDVEDRHRILVADLFEHSHPKDLVARLSHLFQNASTELSQCNSRRNREAEDRLISTGELACTAIVSSYLAGRSIDCVELDSRLLVASDSRFGSARADYRETRKRVDRYLRPEQRAGRAIVTQGFLASTPCGQTTTLGRGGSDTSASLLGEALQVDEIRIHSDVPGLFTTDPRDLPFASPIAQIDYETASELAACGAAVLHEGCLEPARRAGIRVRLLHSHGRGPETTISERTERASRVDAIACRKGWTLLRFTFSPSSIEWQETLLRALDHHSSHLLSLDPRSGDVDLLVPAAISTGDLLDDLPDSTPLGVEEALTTVSVVGRGVSKALGASPLRSLPIEVLQVLRPFHDRSTSFLVRDEERSQLVVDLHAHFFPRRRCA